jgi:hypothetical protein
MMMPSRFDLIVCIDKISSSPTRGQKRRCFQKAKTEGDTATSRSLDRGDIWDTDVWQSPAFGRLRLLLLCQESAQGAG